MVSPEELAQRRHDSQTAVVVGLAANIMLAVAKTTAGLIGRSSALVSDGINSISDTVYYLVVGALVRSAAKPADHEHPYGHTQMESIASLVVGAFVLATAVAILWSEATTLFETATGRSEPAEVGAVALWVALATVAIKAGLSWWTRRRGRNERNSVLVALGDDHTNDLAASAAVAVGILLARRGYHWVDPLAGAIVGLVVFRTGLRILHNSTTELMDAVPSQSLAREIRANLADIAAIRQIEEIHAHRFGPYFVVNLTIGLDGSLSIREGDEICTQIEERLYESMPEIRMVYVHYHPPRAGRRVIAVVPRRLSGGDV
jgi:cation diffusion facilitator family transporter